MHAVYAVYLAPSDNTDKIHLALRDNTDRNHYLALSDDTDRIHFLAPSDNTDRIHYLAEWPLFWYVFFITALVTFYTSNAEYQ